MLVSLFMLAFASRKIDKHSFNRNLMVLNDTAEDKCCHTLEPHKLLHKFRRRIFLSIFFNELCDAMI